MVDTGPLYGQTSFSGQAQSPLPHTTHEEASPMSSIIHGGLDVHNVGRFDWMCSKTRS